MIQSSLATDAPLHLKGHTKGKELSKVRDYLELRNASVFDKLGIRQIGNLRNQ